MFSSAVHIFTDADAYHAAFRDMQAESADACFLTREH